MHKFFIINLNNEQMVMMTYTQIEKKYGIKRNSFKKSVLKLIDDGLIQALNECTTDNEKLYAAILTQDYNVINNFLEGKEK